MGRAVLTIVICISMATAAGADPRKPLRKGSVRPVYKPHTRAQKAVVRQRRKAGTRQRYRCVKNRPGTRRHLTKRPVRPKLKVRTRTNKSAGSLSHMGGALVAQRKGKRATKVKKPLQGKRIKATVRVQHQVDRKTAANLETLRKFVLSASPEKLAGNQRAQLQGAKMPELLAAARSGTLSSHDVATFAQSVHPSLLAVFEKGAKLPRGFFLTVTRSVQFPGGNPFMGSKAPSIAEARKYRVDMVRRLEQIVKLHNKRGGKHLPHALQLLTSTAHITAPTSSGYRTVIRKLVDEIPMLELKKRHTYIMGLTARQAVAQMPTRRALTKQKNLVNYDHLVGTLGKLHDRKLLVEIYAENVPAKGRIGRYLPVIALGEGSYCVDDIARTTVALLQTHQRRPKAGVLKKALAGLSFVKMMQAKDGEFYNFAVLKNDKLKVNKAGATSKKGIDFWAARAVWALGEGYATLRKSDPKTASAMARTINRTLPRLEASLAKSYGKYHTVKGTRLPAWLINDAADQTSVMLKGLLAYHRELPSGKMKNRVEKIITRYAEGVAAAQVTAPAAKDRGRFYHSMKNPGAKHVWGARQVEVLAQAGKQLRKPAWVKAAALCADKYWGKHRMGTLVQPGEEQIAYGAESVVSGYARLHEATGNKAYAQATYRWSTWLFGQNKAGAVMYDPISGRGYDGIASFQVKGKPRYSVNGNSGAESTVEAILALQSAARVPGVHARLRKFLEQKLPK